MIKISLIVGLMTLAGNIFAGSVCLDKYGILHCGRGTIDSINYKGLVNLDGSTVLTFLKARGNVDIQNAKLNSLFVNGNAHLSKSTVSGQVQIVGNVHAKRVEVLNTSKVIGNFFGERASFSSAMKIVGTIECNNCHFKGESTLIGDVSINHSDFLALALIDAKQSIFNHTKLYDITVKNPRDNEEQMIYLKQGSTVRNINFESQKGIVVLDNGSFITGKVMGGKIVKNFKNIKGDKNEAN